MADITNLEQFLTDVATSIKNKKGTTEPIPAANFDTEIESIATGTVVEKVVAEANEIIEEESAVKIDSTPIPEPVVIPENGVAEVLADKALLAENIGLTSDKILKGNTILNVEGTGEGGIMTEEEYLVCNNTAKNILGLDDYVLVEYLQSDGNQYIDTGILMRSDYTYEIKFALNSTTGADTKIFGCDYSPAVTVGTYHNKLRYCMAGPEINKNQDTNTHTVVLNSSCIVDDETITSGMSYNFDYNCYLFNSNYQNFSPTSYGSSCKIYYCKIYNENNELIRDFVPTLNSENKGALYDKVSKTYFNNQGNGNFIVGEVVK